jgi:hypothetical protein
MRSGIFNLDSPADSWKAGKLGLKNFSLIHGSLSECAMILQRKILQRKDTLDGK